MNAFSNLLVDAGAWLLEANLKSAVALVCVAAVCCLSRSWLSARWRSGLWLLALVPLALPIGLPSPTSLWNVLSPRPVAGTGIEGGTAVEVLVTPDRTGLEPIRLTAEGNDVVVTQAAEKPGPPSASSTFGSLSWQVAVAALWLTIAASLLARLAWLTFQLRRWIASRPTMTDPDVLQIANGCAPEAGLARPPRFVDSGDNVGPAVAGWLHPVLLFPHNRLQATSTDRLWFILLHEFRHVAAGDTWVIAVLHVLCAINWFNPLVWLARRKWIEEREIACDAWVLAQTGRDSRLDYADMLFWLSSAQKLPEPLLLSAGMIPFPSLLERRVLAMRHMKPSWRSMVAGLAAVLSIAAVVLTDRVQATSPESDGPAVSSVTEAAPSAAAPVSAKTNPKAEKRPLIVVAQHTLLWNSVEPISVDELKSRLATMRMEGPVKPRVYMSQGWSTPLDAEGKPLPADGESPQTRFRKIMDAVGDRSFNTFLSRRGSKPVDRIKTSRDFEPDPIRVRTGRVVSSSGYPQAGAYVVILPKNDPQELQISEGAVAMPYNEWWAVTNEGGEFKIDPLWDDYNVAIIHRNGYGLISNPLKPEVHVYELQPWSEVSFKPDGWKNGDRANIWVQPDGLDSSWPGINVGTVRTSTPFVTFRAPPGKAKAEYYFWEDGAGSDTGKRHRFVVPDRINNQSETPPEIVLPAPTDEERKVASRQHRGPLATEASKVAPESKPAAAPVAAASVPQKQRRPRIVVAKHTILWNGITPITMDEMKSRLAEMRKEGPVKPNVDLSIGTVFPDNEIGPAKRSFAEVSREIEEAVGGQDQYYMMQFLTRRGSRPFDRVKTADDLKPDPSRAISGRVVTASGVPVPGAQIVILPKDAPRELLYVSDGELGRPYDEWWAVSNERGEFRIDPLCADFRIAIIQKRGYAFLNGPLGREGGEYELQTWGHAVLKKPEGWNAEEDSIEAWLVPAIGDDQGWPSLQLTAISDRYGSPGRTEVLFKSPRGRGYVTYSVSSQGAGRLADKYRFEFDIPETGADRDHPVVVTPSPLSVEDRADAQKKLKAWLNDR